MRKLEQESDVIEQLWQRGRPEDLRAIRVLCEQQPEVLVPECLRGPGEAVFCAAPDSKDAQQVALLLAGQYWTQGLTEEELGAAQLGSNVWLVARDAKSRQVLASARALSDGARLAYVLDVIVRPDRRGSGLGTALMRTLLSHAHVRNVRDLRLRTRDAHKFYGALGFVTRAELGDEMVRLGAR